MIFVYLCSTMGIKRFIWLLLVTLPVFSFAAGIPDTVSPADTLFFDDGSWYLGEIADSMFNGQGKMFYADSTVYEGHWKNGLWDGKGEVWFPDGDRYTGEFKEHLMDGQGVYLYSNGDKYDGRWTAGHFNGVGTYYFSDGSIYTGMWENDRKEGMGILYSVQENATFKGMFHEDTFMGSDVVEKYKEAYPEDVEGFATYSYYNDNEAKYKICLGTSYGISQMLGFHILAESEKAFGGLSLGFNTARYTKGEAAEYTDENGDYHKLVDWNQDPNDVFHTGKYPVFYIGGDYGLTWKKFSVGVMAGVGAILSYKNCKAQTDRVFAKNTYYYKTKVESARFVYQGYCRYHLTSLNLKSDWDGVKTLDLIVSAGYGNVDGIHFGFGLRF